MIGKRLTATAALGLMLLAGCDDRSKSSATSLPPAQTPTAGAVALPTTDKAVAASANEAPATSPTTRPAEAPHSTFFVNDVRSQPLAFNFPRARLHIDREQKTAVLYSDDPKNAIDSKYAGNGYYIVIPLSDDALLHMDGYQWHYKAASSEHQDSADGIFLEGQRFHLQPAEMVVTMNGESPIVNVILQGAFYEFDMTQNTPEGKLVQVKGLVSALVDPPK